MNFKGELNQTEQPSKRNELVKKWREELPILTKRSVLVVGMQNFDQSSKPQEKRADIAVDAIGDMEETRQYFTSEHDVSIIEEEVINEATNRVRFYLKLKE